MALQGIRGFCSGRAEENGARVVQLSNRRTLHALHSVQQFIMFLAEVKF